VSPASSFRGRGFRAEIRPGARPTVWPSNCSLVVGHSSRRCRGLLSVASPPLQRRVFFPRGNLHRHSGLFRMRGSRIARIGCIARIDSHSRWCACCSPSGGHPSRRCGSSARHLPLSRSGGTTTRRSHNGSYRPFIPGGSSRSVRRARRPAAFGEPGHRPPTATYSLIVPASFTPMSAVHPAAPAVLPARRPTHAWHRLCARDR
jgi:hypothetical protein